MVVADALANPNFCKCVFNNRGVSPDGVVMAGRKPLPTKIKQLKGTLQKCRMNLREPQPEGDLVESGRSA